jgi:hypothetical protein
MHHGEAHGKKKATDGPWAKWRVTAFAVRRQKNTWQSLAFAVCHGKTHGNNLPFPCAAIKTHNN